MALNEEKTQSMLNRSIALKAEEEKKPKERMTLLGYQCRDLSHADELHQQLMREIGRNVAEIQKEGLGEHALRDLNSEINRLLYEKLHWERRIVELGGTKYPAKMIDLDGNIVDLPNPGFSFLGFCYFGATANKLPEDRELRKRQILDNMYNNYARLASDRDGVLDREEGPAEKKMRREAEVMLREAEEMRREAEVMRREAEEMLHEAREEKKMRRFQKINKGVLEMKKMEPVSEGPLEDHSEAKDMLNIQG